MKKLMLPGWIMLAIVAASSLAFAQAPREDAIWARRALSSITLDGVLDEPAWAQAESTTVEWAVDAGIPGSGWKQESGTLLISDPSYATLKFLVHENQLYLGARVQDASIGGSENFNRFDGFLMAIKDHLDPGAPKPPAEYFYSWWYDDDDPDVVSDPQPPGQLPAFIGRWGSWPPGTPRTQEAIDNWDAMTVVHGLSNDDTTPDEGYTVEMRFALTPMGYDVTDSDGDVVEWNIGIYDTDWFWPFVPSAFYCTRDWWQCSWGNAAWYGEVRIFARPDVTVSSGPVPDIGPELTLTNIAVAPVMDGALDEAIWNDPRVYTFDMRYDDDALRQTYPAVGPYRAGQYQPEIYGSQAYVLDPADATIKMYQHGDFLYMGFDVRDLFVQHHPDFDRWDGFLITLNHINTRGPDNQLLARRISFDVAQDGSAEPQDYLVTLVQNEKARVALQLKPGTTVDTLGIDADTGYTAELEIDLTAFDYPSGSVDGPFFLGVTMLDGDSFDPYTDSYGTRTWWFRQYEGECCPVWGQLSSQMVGVADDLSGGVLPGYGRAESFPNPSLQPQIRFWLPERNKVTLELYDLRGRLVERRLLGTFGEGEQQMSMLRGRDLGAGVYLYRLRLEDPATGRVRSTLSGKTLLMK